MSKINVKTLYASIDPDVPFISYSSVRLILYIAQILRKAVELPSCIKKNLIERGIEKKLLSIDRVMSGAIFDESDTVYSYMWWKYPNPVDKAIESVKQ